MFLNKFDLKYDIFTITFTKPPTMKDIDLLRKKTGMTIGTALMLMFGAMFSIFIIAGLYGIIKGFKGQKPGSGDAIDLTLTAMVISFAIFSVIGFYVNKKEKFCTNRVGVFTILMGSLVGLLWFVVSSVFYDFYNLNNSINTDGISNTWWFSMAINTVFVLLQIGIIGHGLLRNYDFKKALLVSSIMCVSMFMPAAVISLVFQTGILLFLYYRTASFYLVLAISVVIYTPEYILRNLYNFKGVGRNLLKLDIIKNDTIYFSVWFGCLIALSFCIYILFKNTKTIAWQRESEFVDFEM
jgi:hypothetical protein